MHYHAHPGVAHNETHEHSEERNHHGIAFHRGAKVIYLDEQGQETEDEDLVPALEASIEKIKAERNAGTD